MTHQRYVSFDMQIHQRLCTIHSYTETKSKKEHFYISHSNILIEYITRVTFAAALHLVNHARCV